MSLALGGSNIYSTNLSSGAVNRSYFGAVVVHGKLPEEEPTPEPIYDYYVSELGDGVGTIEDPMSFADSQTTINSMTAGQSIAYKGGDEFYGSLSISGVNGTNGNPITITSYGTGQANFIGSTPLTSWSNESTNIWSASVGTDVYQVFKDNLKLLNTRSDYLTITLDNSTTQFQSDDLIGYGTMDSGTAIMFTTVEWLYELSTVSNFDSATGTVTLSSAPSKGFDVGTEFLVVNNSKELVDGSWSYDTTNNKLYIYSTISPINITATSNTNNGIRPIASYITFDNIVVSQFGGKGIFIEGSDVIINNCLVKDNFDSGITNYNQGERITITNSEISGINGTGISIACNNSVIEYNTVHSIGTSSDMTYKKVTNTSGMGVSGSNSSMSYNTLYNLGYNGIVPNGQYTTVQRNIISDFNTFLTDGAAIYTHTGSTDGIWNIAKALGSVIRNNIITGSDEIKKEPSFGVYLDDCTTDVMVTENTISECATGIYFHNSKRNVASLNNLYYNGVGLVMREEANGDNNGGTNENDGEMVDNIASQNNIFLFSNTYGEGAITLHSTYGNMDLYTGTDNIIHNEGSLFPFRVSMQLVWQGPFIEYSLSDFQTLTGNEIGSTQNTTRQDPFTIDSYDTANTVPNPETGTTGWSATTGSITNPGGYLKLTPTAASTKAKANQTSGNAAFTTDRQMLIEFDIQSGSTIPMAWYLQNQSTPFLNTGEQWNIHPEATWNSHRYIWQSTFTLPNVNIQLFAMEDDEFDFDNVSVREVTLGTPPEVSFLASNDTNVSLDIALPTGTWNSLDGTITNATGTVNVPAYSSYIMIKELIVPTIMVSNTVSADYTTVQAAINAATTDDVIGLYGGDVFNETVTISKSNLTITSYGTGNALLKDQTGKAIDINSQSNININNITVDTYTNEAFYLYSCSDIVIEDNTINAVSTGLYAVECNGGIKFNNNQMLNPQGPYPRGQMVQLNQCSGAGNQINDNVCEFLADFSTPEDLINIYASSGTSVSPIEIKRNQLRGDGGISSLSGGGIMTGDSDGTYMLVENNILVDPGQYGIAASGGQYITLTGNQIYGACSPVSNVGMYAWDWNSTGVCSFHTITNNQVTWYQGTNDKYPDSCTINGWWDAGDCSNMTVSGNDWNANLDTSILPDVILDPYLEAIKQGLLAL